MTSFTLQTPVSTAPKFEYSVDGSYTFHLQGSRSVVANLNWRAVGGQAVLQPVGSCYTPAYGLLGARVDFHPSADSPWTLGFWATNILNTKVELTETGGPTGGIGGMGISSYVPGRPAEFGIEARRTF